MIQSLISACKFSPQRVSLAACRNTSFTKFACVLSAIALSNSIFATATFADDPITGYTAPYKQIDLAAAEPGLLISLDIKEGQKVKEGDIIGKLNHKVLLKTLAVAEKEMNATGALKSAQAELRLKRDRLNRLNGLHERGHASGDEIQTAQAERDVALARVQAAEESLEIKKLEYARVKAQLERRFVKAPFHGTVTFTRKNEGEFVPANDPSILTVVQLDPLIATFSLTPKQALSLAENQSVGVRFGDQDRAVFGNVTFVSPVDDAESGTVRIKVEIPNTTQKLRAGSKVNLVLEQPSLRERRQRREEIGQTPNLPKINPRPTVKR